MKPQFNPTLTLFNDGKSVHVEGPIDLDGTEVDAYFWLRIAQGGDEDEVEAIGTLELEKDELEAEFVDAANRTHKAAVVLAAAGPVARGPLGAATTMNTISKAGPAWEKKSVTAKDEKAFEPGTAVAEAWALVRTENEEGEEGEFQMFWRKDVKLV